MNTASVQFFNFGNDETYHCFRWVTEGGRVSPDRLIQDAAVQALAELVGGGKRKPRHRSGSGGAVYVEVLKLHDLAVGVV
jgi:hypothetical protein